MTRPFTTGPSIPTMKNETYTPGHGERFNQTLISSHNSGFHTSRTETPLSTAFRFSQSGMHRVSKR